MCLTARIRLILQGVIAGSLSNLGGFRTAMRSSGEDQPPRKSLSCKLAAFPDRPDFYFGMGMTLPPGTAKPFGTAGRAAMARYQRFTFA